MEKDRHRKAKSRALSIKKESNKHPPSIPLLHRLAFLLLSASLAARVLALLRVLKMIAVFFEDGAVVAELDDEDEEV